MLTLGIHDGHTATAALVDDGEIAACVSEERLNRIKEWSGFPEGAILSCLDISGRKAADIDAVGICSLMPQTGADHYHNPHGYKKVFAGISKIVPAPFLRSSANVKHLQRLSGAIFKGRRQETNRLIDRLGIVTDKREFFEHHSLHAATTYYTNWYKRDRTLIITLDGSGDAVCGSINIGEGGSIRRIAEVFNYNSFCEFYTRVTQFLGMKPMAHEYKVMGMAPYASESRRKALLEKMRTYFIVPEGKPLQFHNMSGRWKWGFLEELRESLAGQRFDWVAGAVQDFFEEITLKWIRNAIRETGIRDLCLSGGGFMNVKVNYLVSQLPEVESLFVFPSCGDESNPVGAAILAAIDAGFPAEQVKPLGMIYWGPAYGEQEIQNAMEKKLVGKGLRISRHENINQLLAEKLAEGKILGRFTGRMEWGARALGNRSIVADPRNQKVIHRINKAIKMRDFWMPFAPAILDTYRKEYLLLRDDYRCPFMTIAPDTKPRAWEDIPAGLHPFDQSARAQILDSTNHPSFYDLVGNFERLTGVGGVLNTSFNLHGDPVVCSPDDAIETFLNSGLDILQLENVLIEK